VTHLRKLMLDELQGRNYSQNTVRSYIHAVEDFAKYFRRSPDRLGPNHIREYQVHLFRDCKLAASTIEGRTAALRFLFVKTLRRPYLPDHIPFPKRQRRMPTVLSQEEVARLIDSAQNLMHRTMLMMLYATGLRRAELCHLKVSDIDSERMVIHVRQGKVGRDRDVLPLTWIEKSTPWLNFFVSGPVGRRFKSSLPDQFSPGPTRRHGLQNVPAT
jgi:integrase/recombinase XerD